MRKHKFIAFDIETATNTRHGDEDLLTHRPLGITCAAVVERRFLWNKATLFYSKNSDGTPAPQMTQSDLCGLVDLLLERVDDGYMIVTINGLKFDFDVLAEESGRFEDCRKLALGHVDMTFQLLCERGFPVGLAAAAQAIGRRKYGDVDGKQAPQLWMDGRHKRVLKYVRRDCELTLAVARKSQWRCRFYWITKAGRKAYHWIPGGWLTVEEAMELPLPDTSWMDAAFSREEFSAWLDAPQADGESNSSDG